MARPTKASQEAKAHAAKLKARRMRRARRKAEQAENDAILAEDIRISEAASKPAKSDYDPRVLGAMQQALAGSASPKRITEARENLSSAFEAMGGVPMLVAWGSRNLTEFYRLWARLIPKEEAPKDAGRMPLEDLLDKLASREEQTVREAAIGIGIEKLGEAAKHAIVEVEANLDDAIAAYNGETMQ